MSRLPLTPPIRFGTVAFPVPGADLDWDSESDDERRVASFTECLYRGAYPKQRNLRFLQTLHLRTIVSLTPKPIDSDPALAQWASEQNGGTGIRLVHIRTEKPKEESGGLSREGAARAIAVSLDRENLPLYIHCLDGIEATSTFVACLRRLQGWSDVGVREEFARGLYVATTRIGGAPFDVPRHLAQFVERFGQPDGVRMPPISHIPCWLWPVPIISNSGSAPVVQHGSIKLHFEPEHTAQLRSSLSGVVWSTVALSRSSPSSWLSLSGSSEQGSRLASDVEQESTIPGESSGVQNMAASNADLRTPRARPTLVEGDIPPLGQRERVPDGDDDSNIDMPTPLVKPSETAIPTNVLDVPELGEAEADADAELDEEDVEEEFPEDDDVRRLEALDLEGF